MRYHSAWIGLFGVALIGSAQAVEVYFWGTDKSPPKGVVTDGHPCGGSVVIMDVTKVPSDNAWLKADTIREVDGIGRVLRTWRVPADHYPVGLEGDTLVLAFGSDPEFTLKVAADGALSKGPAPRGRELEVRACPANLGPDKSCAVISKQPLEYLVYAPICS